MSLQIDPDSSCSYATIREGIHYDSAPTSTIQELFSAAKKTYIRSAADSTSPILYLSRNNFIDDATRGESAPSSISATTYPDIDQ